MTDWPFGTDADRDDPLTARRIAVTSSHTRWFYLVAFDRDSEARPTDHEADLLVSYLDHYKDHWYGNSGFRAEMEERALDVDGGANGVIFHKWGPHDWGYRRQSFTMGPLFWPGWDRERRYSLAGLMDHMQTYGSDEPISHWRQWKADHPDVFAAVAR
jgi:hypothetical protein